MRFSSSRQFKRYITRLIKEEKEAMDNPFAEFEDMDDLDEMEPMSDVSDGSFGGYGSGYADDFDRATPETEMDEAVIPLKLLKGARRLSESANVSVASRKVAAAYSRFKSGRINESEFYKSLRKITGIPTYRTYVSNGARRVSIRKFVRG